MNIIKNILNIKISIFFLKKQIGGRQISLFGNTIGIDRPSSIMLRIINKFFGNEKIIKDDIIFVDHINNELITIEDTENIDRNIFILKTLENQDDKFVSQLSFEYLTTVLNEYQDINIFISFASLNIKDFYLPKFMDEYLELNAEEKLTVFFTGKDYSSSIFPLNITTLNEYLGTVT